MAKPEKLPSAELEDGRVHYESVEVREPIIKHISYTIQLRLRRAWLTVCDIVTLNLCRNRHFNKWYNARLDARAEEYWKEEEERLR